MTTPKISVCMPMFNASRYLRECIDSILAQTFTDFELLIADDGSTDNSIEIAQSYTDPRIRLIRRPHDYIATLNCLLNEARGKYIARMDADDIMLPTRLQLQFDYMEAHPDVDVLGSTAVIFSDDSTEDVYELSVSDAIVVLRDLLTGNCICNPTTFIRKKAIYEKNLRYEHRFPNAEDYYFWYRCILAGLTIYNTSEITMRYRLSHGQVSSEKNSEMKQQAKQIKHLVASSICKASNLDYIPPLVQFNDAKLTVIIPFLNEGIELIRTVESILKTSSNRIQIIAINDCSTDEYDYKSALEGLNVSYVVNFTRKGVAQSRDFGVKLSKTPYVMFLDAHMRALSEDWDQLVINELQKNPYQILCAQTDVIYKNYDGSYSYPSKLERPDSYGAYIDWGTKGYNPDPKWSLFTIGKEDISHIPVVLGASYATSIKFWEKIDGLTGLKSYGSDEPYISIKAWGMGGSCSIVKHVVFSHLYRKSAPYYIPEIDCIYNRLLIANVLLPDPYNSIVESRCLLNSRLEYFEAVKQLSANRSIVCSFKRRLEGYVYTRFNKINSIITRINQKDNLMAREALIHEAYEFLEKQAEPQNIGMINGLGARLLWFALYYNMKQQSGFSQCVQNKLTELNNITLNSCQGVGFNEGLTGIGWLNIFLFRVLNIGDDLESILKRIDVEISNYIKKNENLNNDEIIGIFCYVNNRICLSRTKGFLSLSSDLIYILTHVANELLDKYPVNDWHVVFNVIRFVNLSQDNSIDNMWSPKCSEWLNPPNFISESRNYWISNLEYGIDGYTLPALLAFNHKYF
ncbi:MAG: glycosyltransferase [Bacteroides sp.]|nr:glycosyltransferase [Bacteroides sp.]